MPVVLYGGVEANKSLLLWNNHLSHPQVTVTDTGSLAAYPAINAAKDINTWSVWKGTATGAARLNANIPPGRGWQRNNALGISNHNLASSGSSIRLWHSDDDESWSSVFPDYAPLSDEDILFHFPATTHRYWRVVATGPSPSIGIVSLGEALVMPRTPKDDYTPLHHARKYTKYFNDSLKGQFIGNRVMGAGADTQVDFGFVDRSFADGPFRGFEDHYNRGGTFFYAGWPGGAPQDIGYCRAAGEDESVAVSYIEADKLASISFGVRSFVGV